tara:strand:- start:489 stop:854 length:366 start_codon:yes stop_codon:yes gene_type:complete
LGIGALLKGSDCRTRPSVIRLRQGFGECHLPVASRQGGWWVFNSLSYISRLMPYSPWLFDNRIALLHLDRNERALPGDCRRFFWHLLRNIVEKWKQESVLKAKNEKSLFPIAPRLFQNITL